MDSADKSFQQNQDKLLNNTLFSITERDMMSEMTSINDRRSMMGVMRYNLNEDPNAYPIRDAKFIN